MVPERHGSVVVVVQARVRAIRFQVVVVKMIHCEILQVRRSVKLVGGLTMPLLRQSD